jgi:outer membrane protein
MSEKISIAKKMSLISFIMSSITMVGIIVLLTKDDTKKTAFFMSAEVYNEFDYKNELEAELIAFNDEIVQSIDSLEQDLQMTVQYLKSISPSEEQMILFERKQQYFFETKSLVEAKYEEKAQESYSLIWDRINGYVNDYGKDNEYVYIFGANGDGTMMYADESENITAELITHINAKYAGE